MINDLQGRRVLITISHPRLQNPILRPRVDILEQESVTIIANVVEADDFGIWIEYPEHPFPEPGKKQPEKKRAYILIRYEFITSISHFPDIPASETAEQRRIGFIDAHSGTEM